METAEALAAALAAHGTEVCFGMPGGGINLAVIGACERAGVRFVLTRAETPAVIAAASYGELTGRPGLAICTRGPGLAAAANGLAQALLDRQPVVVACDGAGHASAHQRLDHAGLGGVVAKATVTDAAAAVRIALEAPPGPVLLDIGAPGRPVPAPSAFSSSLPPPLPPARRPLVIAGLAARGAAAELRELVGGTAIPVLTTYRGKGLVPESWPNAAGLFTGATLEAPLIARADLVVLVGVDPVELIPGSWRYEAPLVSLTPWPLDDGYFPPHPVAVGPLPDLLARLALDASGWERSGGDARREGLVRLDVRVPGLAPQDVVRAVREVLPPDAIATVDSGAHMLVAMPFFTVERPQRCLISSGLATMGFALPAALGASYATDAPVVCLIGDGGLAMCLAELETLARCGRDVRVVVFDDARLSLIAIKQGAGDGGPGAVEHGPVDYAAAARALGVSASTATTAAEVAAAVARPGPSLVDVHVDPSGYAAVLAATRG